MPFEWNTRKIVKLIRSYANECKKQLTIHVEIVMRFGCRDAIHKNFGGAIRLIQKSSLGKNLMHLDPVKFQ